MYTPIKHQKVLTALIALTSTVIFLRGVDAWYYAEDFNVIPNLEDGILSNFVSSVGPDFYRPIQSILLELQIELFGWSTVPIHILTIFFHLLCGAAVYYWIRKLSGSDWGGLIGSSLFLLSPVSVYPVLGNDTLSQVGATVLGFLGFIVGGDMRHEQIAWKGGLAGIFLTCAIFFKETAVVYPILLAGFILWRSYDRSPITKTALSILRKRKIIWLVATLAAGAALYLPLRILGTGLSVGSSSNFVFSSNPIHIVRNVSMTFGGMAVGGSYVEIFQNLRSGRWLALTPPALLSVACMGSVIWGARKNRQLQTAIVTFLLSVLTLGPLLFMRSRPSPLYLYGGLPFFASAVGVGIAGFFEQRRIKPKVIAGGIMALFFLLQTSGSHNLVSLMVKNGNQARAWFDCINKAAEKSKKGESISVFLRGKGGGPFIAPTEDRVARDLINYVDERYEHLNIHKVGSRREGEVLDHNKCKKLNNN